MPRGRRRRLAKGIYRDAIGIAAVVWVKNRPYELRFPQDTPLDEVRVDMRAKRDEVLESLPEGGAPGTLADLVARHVSTLGGDRQKDRQQLLAPWVDALGGARWATLTRAELQGVADRWRAGGLSAARINKRISALRVCWRSQAPDRARPHGVEQLTRYGQPPAIDRAVPMTLVQVVLDALPTRAGSDAGSARIRVMAWTGQPPRPRRADHEGRRPLAHQPSEPLRAPAEERHRVR